MASAIPTSQDTLVTLKISIGGSNRRFKLPLRDLGASTLPDKLRFLLAIPPTAEAVFERYSDSAAAFIVLDTANSSVYKQLYRAAKAKLKLRLKVTVMDKNPAVVPKPASVEDDEPAPVTPVSNYETLITAAIPEAPTTVTPAQESVFEKKPVESVSEMQRDFEKLMIDNIQKLPPPCQPWAPSATTFGNGYDSYMNNNKESARVNDCSSTEIPVTRGAVARVKLFADLAGLSAECNGVYPSHPVCPALPTAIFSVYCNNCQAPIPDTHYHCSTCDEGDFDLCQSCVGNGVVCGSDDHWMIKRFVKNGKVINSTTERIAPKPKAKEPLPVIPTELQAQDSGLLMSTRTCNSCIQELSVENFVTCTFCPDFDLCITCHVGMEHGHHPKHAFEPAVIDTKLGQVAKKLLPAGRNIAHDAICDGCDKYIYGVRHKCLDCPDWDLCSSCITSVNYIHPRHRFVPIYEALNDTVALSRAFQSKSRHHGIYCDGPLCSASKGVQTYIKGDRYKCAVCHDTDFCASCEASPANTHNRTHPLIKFKTPVRNVNVTTLGDHENGQLMPIMGDRRGRTTSKATETTQAQSINAATQVQTIADVQPTEPKVEVREVEPEVAEVEVRAEEAKELSAVAVKADLVAHFVRDAVADGTVLAPNTVFEQTWYLRNGGQSPWPAGCSVKFVSGDNMCSSDPEHPASIHELVSAAESTTCYSEVTPGQEVGFTVLLRTPKRVGTCISYWRLTGPDGNKFGHRLWCDISVKEAEVKEEPKQVETQPEMQSSQMIFPKLEKESPTASIHHSPLAASETAEIEEMDEFDADFGNEQLEHDDETEDGFMTDEEYDILDASDEEYLVEQGKASRK